MTDNFPRYVEDILVKNFTKEEIKLIDSNWIYYVDYGFRFGSATEQEIIDEVSMILKCAKEQNLAVA